MTTREYKAKILRSVGDDRVIIIDLPAHLGDKRLGELIEALQSVGVMVHSPQRDGAL